MSADMTSITMPHTAMVFAAGLGTRMRAHRDDIPKPLVPVAGRPLIDRVLDKLVAVGVSKAVVNVSYMGDKIVAHLADRKDIRIIFSEESTPLETGGGIRKALPLLGNDPFFIINSDIGWIDGPVPALARLASFYDESNMDAALLVCPVAQAVGYDGQGDFIVNKDGRLRWCRQKACDMVFTGVQMMHPRAVRAFRPEAGEKAFSLWRFFDGVDEAGHISRVQAIAHDAQWLHIGDAQGVQAAEKFL